MFNKCDNDYNDDVALYTYIHIDMMYVNFVYLINFFSCYCC